MQRFFNYLYEDHSWEVWLLCAVWLCQLTPPKPAGARPRTPKTAPGWSSWCDFQRRAGAWFAVSCRRQILALFSVTSNDLTSLLAANSQEAISGSYADNQPIHSDLFSSVSSHSHLSIVTLIHYKFLILMQTRNLVKSHHQVLQSNSALDWLYISCTRISVKSESTKCFQTVHH